MEDIPVKLRCATCNKLANNAFRMPCCDQSICEDCKAILALSKNTSFVDCLHPGQASLPDACPVCFHEPVKADDCRPNKALRTTIKVFLRKKLVERESAAKKRLATEKVAAAPATPLTEEAPTRQPSQTLALPVTETSKSASAAEARLTSPDPSQTPHTPNVAPKASEHETPTEAQKDIPQKSIEVRIQFTCVGGDCTLIVYSLRVQK